MGMDDDYALALKLQQQFENEFVPNNENEVVVCNTKIFIF